MKHDGGDHLHAHDSAMTEKYGSITLATLRKIYGKFFAAGHPDTLTLSEVLPKLNDTSLSQLRRDHDTGHLKKKISKAA
ncbi:hypothetical protein [Tardiphaga sp. P9-11]|jgi:hypothetical protein|uniref:hypothetical protein n=1 Tax=Tardiphaga sp. P9-11 TaxID=2024614 RepID=UPI000D5C46E5|nr:hypothetical protein [Tardiphaga sp. P9-11]KAA0073283.1 hypothetical protein CIW50_21605 [Tardiphaga sp. P9-11]